MNLPIRTLLVALCLTTAPVFTGCQSDGPAASAPAARPASAQIDVFKDGEKPSRAFKSIGLLKDDGKDQEQEQIEAKMIAKAKKMGGQAILFDKPKQSGMEAEFFSFGQAKFTYLYKANVVVYE